MQKLPMSIPEDFSTSDFDMQNRALATVLCPYNLLKNRGHISATPGATLPENTEGFTNESGFTREFSRSRFRTVALPKYLRMGG